VTRMLALIPLLSNSFRLGDRQFTCNFDSEHSELITLELLGEMVFAYRAW
jgi:hypothetical protein